MSIAVRWTNLDRSESDGQISITGGSDRSDGKNVYRRRNVCQLGKHNITMH